MKISVNDLSKAINKLPEPKNYPYPEIKIPIINKLLAQPEKMDCSAYQQSNYLLFEKDEHGIEWTLVYA